MAALDERDLALLTQRQAALDAIPGPRVGDWVEFPDSIVRRISYLWPADAQTSDGGSFYLGKGYVSMSGSLYRSVPTASLVRTERTRPGSVWFFHHDFPAALGGVETSALFRIYTCPLPAPR